MKARLILEDGTVIIGRHHGSDEDVLCEIVFNTSMTGYQEVLSDPSYQGQGVIMTYPLIGNYGVNDNFRESEIPHASALIAHEISDIDSHFASQGNLDDYLKEHHVFGISEIDTRALTRKIREHGTMMAFLTTKPLCFKEIDFQQNYDNDFVSQVTCKQQKHYPGNTYHVALYDFGMKRNILRQFLNRGYEVTVFPANTKASEILLGNYDGIMLSNGPGDPKQCRAIINELKILYQTDIPIFAICLGHQLMALANGFDTYKLKYGHRGGNHPVMDLRNEKVYLSSQNHGYVVDSRTLDETIAKPLFINVNDKTNEGLYYLKRPMISVQFHPEASPGPQDSCFLFEDFYKMMEEYQDAKKSQH